LKLLQKDPEDTKAALIQLNEEWLHYPAASETTQELLTQVRKRTRQSAVRATDVGKGSNWWDSAFGGGAAVWADVTAKNLLSSVGSLEDEP
jgi:hypothetical protein